MIPFQQHWHELESNDNLAKGHMGDVPLDHFKNTLSIDEENLTLMASGKRVFRGRYITLREIKHYYGIEGKTAAECLEKLLEIKADFYNKFVTNKGTK